MAEATQALLEVSGLTMRFGGLKAIDELSLQVPQRSVTAIIGPNGAGKTTLFNCLTGFYKPSSGDVCLNHPRLGAVHLQTLPSHRVARDAGVVRTFQNIRLFPKMTVLENLVVAQHNPLQTASRFSLAGRIRVHMAPVIVQQIYGSVKELDVIALEPELERLVAQALNSPHGASLDPGMAETLTRSAAETANKQEELGLPACLLVPDLIRAPIARLLRRAAPRLKVLAHSEIPETHSIRIGSVIGASA